ncbi:MAG: nitrate reductase cytochrome c-type subunit [Candidatus Accumulibacter necessarius]|jgi:cytochrome c-type protein NapB
MRGADVAAPDQAPDIKTYVGKRPGTEAPVARTFSTQPPVIPHAVENFDEINLEGNQCMDCHSAATYQKKKAPKIGDSHFIDRRRQEARRSHRRPIQLRAMSRAAGRRAAAGRQHLQG